MIETVKGALYKAFGFNIACEFSLPELLTTKREESADIEIVKGDLTEQWRVITKEKGAVKFAVRDQMVMFQVPDTGIFCIKSGRSIIVSPMRESDEDKIRLYILGTCMGVLLMQRKILPLHGSTVAVNGKAYILVGRSGAGKSTLATALMNRGYPLLCDDVSAVSLTGGNLPFVTPSYPQQKLWQESIQQLGMAQGNFQPLFERENKFAIPIRSKFYAEPLPLAGVIELGKTDHEDIQFEPIHRLERLHLLYRNTYRNSLISRLGLMEWHFYISASVAKAIHFYRIQRPVLGFTADQLASLIIGEINKGGIEHDR